MNEISTNHQPDEPKARDWMAERRDMAEKGNAWAQYFLGQFELDETKRFEINEPHSKSLRSEQKTTVTEKEWLLEGVDIYPQKLHRPKDASFARLQNLHRPKDVSFANLQKLHRPKDASFTHLQKLHRPKDASFTHLQKLHRPKDVPCAHPQKLHRPKDISFARSEKCECNEPRSGGIPAVVNKTRSANLLPVERSFDLRFAFGGRRQECQPLLESLSLLLLFTKRPEMPLANPQVAGSIPPTTVRAQ